MGIIYKVENVITNKVYIGKTVQSLDKRRNAHLIKSKKSNTYFHNSIRKYGIENFEWLILEESSKDKLDSLEKDYISKYKSNIKEFGYNLTDGADGCLGYKCTKEQIENRRKAANIRWSNPDSRKIASENMKLIVKDNPKYIESIRKAIKASVEVRQKKKY